MLCTPGQLLLLVLLALPVASQGMDEGGLDYAFNRAIDAYYNDRKWFRALQVRTLHHLSNRVFC